MINLGIVSTGWISDSFAEACVRTGMYRIAAVCSRQVEQAETFGKKYGATLFFNDIHTLAACDGVDAVYVASPNALHYGHCMAALGAGKHVIVEKPAFSNIGEAREAFTLAREKGVLLLEAIRSLHEANHGAVKAAVAKIGPLCGANLSFMKRSPRYDLVLAGEAPAIFTLEYSGGALMDLGVYLIYDAVDWFGMPQSAAYYCHKAHTGADTGGVVLLRYADYNVVLNVSKICNSYMVNEIRSRDHFILLDAAHNMRSVRLLHNSGGEEELAQPPKDNWMDDEALCFARLIGGNGDGDSNGRYGDRDVDGGGQYEALERLSLDVHTLMTELRLGAGIIFPADEVHA
ncbi:MAG: Gfo/Idh/MocA family oxidoreductase [Oscillospiraceae bacterium]|nr:Gfo/Idh/MocA family oxidoreductase [Oscillospiraceae bacterium]